VHPLLSHWRDAGSVLRHQLGALVASIVDFSVMIACVHAGLSPVGGTALGAACGAATNFTLARHWIFPSNSPDRAHRQAARYGLVSAGSLGLNTLGEFALHNGAHTQYVLARLLVAVSVSLAWNYPLQRLWVFAPRRTHPQRAHGPSPSPPDARTSRPPTPVPRAADRGS
jgi:putative flippase GtrA